MSITFPLSLITYSMYAFLSSVSNLCWVSFHTIFGTPAPPLPVPEMVVLAIISVSACVWSFFYGTVNSCYLHMIIAVHTNRILLYKLFFFFFFFKKMTLVRNACNSPNLFYFKSKTNITKFCMSNFVSIRYHLLYSL